MGVVHRKRHAFNRHTKKMMKEKNQELCRKWKTKSARTFQIRKHVTFLETSACVTYSPDDSRKTRQSQSTPSPVALNVKEMTWNEWNTKHDTNKLCLSIFYLNFYPNFFINALTENEIIFLQNKKKRMKNWKKMI